MALTRVNGSVDNIFDTVADMKGADLPAGSYVETKGYYTAGEGGAAKYLIQTAAEFGATPDGYGDHLLANGHVAVLPVEGIANVKQFGAVGDFDIVGRSGTDDTLAIQAAINRADTIVFPEGAYYSGELTIRRGVTLQGTQRETSIVVCRDQHLINWVWDGTGATQLKYFNAQDLTFDQKDEVASHATFKLYGALHNDFRRVTFRGVGSVAGATGLCIDLQDAYFNSFRDIQCENTGYGFFLRGTSFSNGPNDNYFENINLNNTSNWGIRLDYARGNHFEGVDAEYGNPAAIQSSFIINNSSYNKVSHFWYENVGGDLAGSDPAITISATSQSNNKNNIIEWCPQIISGSIGISVSDSIDTKIRDARFVGNGIGTGISETGNSGLVIDSAQYDNCATDTIINSNNTVIAEGTRFTITKNVNAQFSVDSLTDSTNKINLKSGGAFKFQIGNTAGSNVIGMDTATGRAMTLEDDRSLTLPKTLAFSASQAAAGVPNNSLFRDSADQKLKYKDSGGTVNVLY